MAGVGAGAEGREQAGVLGQVEAGTGEEGRDGGWECWSKAGEGQRAENRL
jgi:hypothetical protein